MKTLRQHYLDEWRIWYNALNKAKKQELEIYPDWLDFETWFSELGPRLRDTDQFCRDDWSKGWTPDNAGWRTMPWGRNKEYGYAKTAYFNKESNRPQQ